MRVNNNALSTVPKGAVNGGPQHFPPGGGINPGGSSLESRRISVALSLRFVSSRCTGSAPPGG